MNPFVEEVTTRRVVSTMDGEGPDGCDMSVVKVQGGIELVIGARYEDGRANSLTKRGVGELISILQDIEEAMK